MEEEYHKNEEIYYCQRYQLADNMIQDLKALFYSF
jgi:hypothetical protein